MPGSSITCTGLSSIYDTNYFIAHGGPGSVYLGLSIDPSNDTFNVDTSKAAAFPFFTGDVFYFSVSNIFTKYFAIRISATSIKAATTYENAINNIAVDLTITDATPTSTIVSYKYCLSNTLATGGTGIMKSANYYVSSNWPSSTVSSIKLGVGQNFTYSFIIKQGTMTGIKSIGSNFVNSDPTTNDFALGILYPFVASGLPYLIGRESNSPATNNGFNRTSIPVGNVTGQFRCVNKVISFDYIASGVTTTVYSTSALTITNQLEIFCYSGTNNAGLTDCIITYT